MRMQKLWPMLGVAAMLAGSALSPGFAASHKDWTVVPLGSFVLRDGEQTIQVSRPYDRFGLIVSPIVFTVVAEPSRGLTQPIELRLAQEQREWPAWTVHRIGQTYVIGVNAQVQAAGSPEGKALTLRVTAKNAPPGLALMASGAPDLGLAGSGALGPLEDVVKTRDRSAAREYLNALAGLASGHLTMSIADFERLANGPDETVARFARAALHRLRFADAEAHAADSFAAQYRLGLYAQQCGLFRAARVHLESALRALNSGQPQPPDWYVSEAWFRLGEMMERCGEPIDQVAEVMERAGTAARVKPNVWDVWVTLLLAADCEETRDGQKTTVRVQMTAAEIEKIKREWHWVEQMLYGASSGHLQLNTRYIEIPDVSAVPYGLNAGWLYGPLDALVPARGSVDCVMSFRPRGPSVTGGADCGPNGAAMTDIGTWCGWEVYLHEWNHQFDWTVRTDEAADGYPITHHSDSCGHQPIPSMGYGHRASMHYYLTPAAYHRIQPADPDPGEGYLRNWWINSPIPIDDTPPAKELPPHQVTDRDPNACRSGPPRFLAANGDFIDLKAFFAERNVPLPQWCITLATTYVYAPTRQEVRLWLGHNDGAAVWLNGEQIHRGDYFAIAKFEDQDWPNMVAVAAVLQKGWNRLELIVEGWPPPRDKGCGYSVRVCDGENRPVNGLRLADAKTELPATFPPDPLRPTPGRYYRWDDVRDDFYRRLPRLNGNSLGGDGFRVTASIGATQGYVALGTERDRTGQTRGGVTLRELPTSWDRVQDADTRLNNVLDWNREAVAIYPIHTSQPQRCYLVMRPEAVEAYLTCLREADVLPAIYGGRPLRERILGYVQVGDMRDDDGIRVLIVADVCLPTPLPADEEDLLAPVAP